MVLQVLRLQPHGAALRRRGCAGKKVRRRGLETLAGAQLLAEGSGDEDQTHHRALMTQEEVGRDPDAQSFLLDAIA